MAPFFARTLAIIRKEFIQMRRDRLTFAVMLMIPVAQIILFGYAINSDPKHLPTAVHAEESSPQIRRILAAMESSARFNITATAPGTDARTLLQAGKVSFAVSFPKGFTRALLRGERPDLLLEADASDPVAVGAALADISTIVNRALNSQWRGPLSGLAPAPSQVNLVVHRAFNPEDSTQYNIVPGLLGVILTLTLVMFTGIAMTRERERGTWENLLAMPALPSEVMVGKIIPYLFVGLVQAVFIIAVGRLLFHVPFLGSKLLLLGSTCLFIATNLTLGFAFGCIARNQLQAMQLTFFFFLPSMLLSGFMFPFRGMPGWAQVLGEVFPLTHFLRIVRGIMLKGSFGEQLLPEYGALALFMVVVGLVALLRYQRTLD